MNKFFLDNKADLGKSLNDTNLQLCDHYHETCNEGLANLHRGLVDHLDLIIFGHITDIYFAQNMLHIIQ